MNLAGVLSCQGQDKVEEAVRLCRRKTRSTTARSRAAPILRPRCPSWATTPRPRHCCAASSPSLDYAEVVATRERLHGPEDARTLQVAIFLRHALRGWGKELEAEAVFRPALAAQERFLCPEHPGTLNTNHNLACSLAKHGKLAEAVLLLWPALELFFFLWIVWSRNRGSVASWGQGRPTRCAPPTVWPPLLDTLSRHAGAEAEAVRKVSARMGELIKQIIEARKVGATTPRG